MFYFLTHNLFLFFVCFKSEKRYLILLKPVSKRQISPSTFSIWDVLPAKNISAVFTWFGLSEPKLGACNSCLSVLWGQPFQKGILSPLCCSAFLLLTLKCLLVHPFAPWPPGILDILCILYTMVETAPLVGSALAVSTAVTAWKCDGNRTWVTTWNEMLADNVAGECILWYPSKKTYMVLF